MKKALLSFVLFAIGILPLFGAVHSGDITAAVRVAGGMPTVSSSPATGQSGSCANTGLFDGILSIGDAEYPSSGQRFFFQKTASASFALDYTVPESFCPGEDIVVTAVVFAVGRAKKDGSTDGQGGAFTSYKQRMPGAWTLEGSNDGVSWSSIATVTNQSGYAMSEYNGVPDVYSGTCDIANSASYRRYRITVTANTGDATYMVQLTEVKLLGFYGGTYSAVPQKEDLTAAVRALANVAAGEASSPNLEAYKATAIVTMSVERAFDGTASNDTADRFLATADSTSSALADGGAIIEYEFCESFRNGGDIVVTGYTLETYTAHMSALQRMPKDWSFEAYDVSAGRWIVLDTYENFVQWETREVDGCSQYATDFSFPNTTAYRKYRIRINSLNGGTQVQFSEIRLYGYIGRGIAGHVGADRGEGHSIDMTAWGREYFTPVVSNSECSAILSGTHTTNLFDGVCKNDWVLYTLGDGYFPFCVYYEIPTTCLPGAEFVAKGYTIATRYGDVSDYEERRPYSWSLEGYCEERGRWVAIDKRSSFTSWLDDTENLCHYADFTAEGGYAFRRYRLKVNSVKAKSSTGLWQLAMSEIVLRGEWGKSISENWPQSNGLTIIFR